MASWSELEAQNFGLETTLDYDTSLVSKGFIFNNPNAKRSCGCGSSFRVKDEEQDAVSAL